MKSRLKVTVAAIGLISSILISAAAAPASAKITSIGYIAENEDVMTEKVEQSQKIEIKEIDNSYEFMPIENEEVNPTKTESKPSVSSQPSSLSKPQTQTSSNKTSSSSGVTSAPSSSAAVQTPSQSVSSQEVVSEPPQQVINVSRPTFTDYSAITTPTPVPAVNYAGEVSATYRDENGGEVLWFNGQRMAVKEAHKHIVSNEVNSAFCYEAIKAQVVATHSYIKYYNDSGKPASVGYKNTIDPSVDRAVEEVFNVIATYNGRAIYAPYFACSAGSTQASREVWGGNIAYLVAAESKYDYLADYVNGVKKKSNYLAYKTLSADTVKNKIINKFGVTPSGDPSTWFTFLSRENNGYTSGEYINKIVVAGKTTTGKNLRDIFGLRSACFDISYANGTFTFITRGYGHGVGLSQWGAHFYAINDGWNYQQIISHYYTGVSIATVV